MLHEDGHHHVDQDELGQQHKHHEIEWSQVLKTYHPEYVNNDERDKDLIYTAVLQTVVSVITLLPESVLHDPVPVVPRGDPEECEEGHSKGSEVSVLTQSLEQSII